MAGWGEGWAENLAGKQLLQYLQQFKKKGGREVAREIAYFNLDVIISVGYRVKSKRGVEFRQWASGVLRRYLLEGYAINFRRIETAPRSLVELFKMQVQLWEKQELLNKELKDDIGQIGEKIQATEAKLGFSFLFKFEKQYRP